MTVAAADAETQFQTGLSMLAGKSLAPDWKQAVELIDAAADAGHAGAIERRALLECRGVGRALDWDRALDSLAEAAERGSPLAGRQLILLAEDRFAADSAEPPAADWATVRSRVSVDRRIRPPASQGRVLSHKPIVHAVPDFASAAECAWLIAKAGPQLERAVVYNERDGVDPGRTNRSAALNFANADLVVETIQHRIANQLKAPLGCLEMSQVLHYSVGQEFVLHRDALDPRQFGDELARNGQRVATVLIYLNQDYEGGETSFPRLGIAHRGKAGDVLVFGNVNAAGQPDPMSQHAGLAPTAGEKWVFSQWVRNKAPERG